MSADAAPESPYLTAKEAARYLHVNEKKLYALANARELPAAKVGGKWLFPKALLDAVLLEQAHAGALADRLLIAGSDDPWLSAAISALAAELAGTALVAQTPTTTLDGLDLLAQRRVSACTLNWGPRERSAQQHPALLRRYAGHGEWTLMRLAEREQGVILRPGLGARELVSLVGFDYRWAMRPPGAGAQHYLMAALTGSGFSVADCSQVAEARSERQAAALVAQGVADCAPGTRGGAGEFGLDFLPLGWAAFDLALPQAVCFRRLFLRLIETLGSAPLRSLASRLGGYDLATLGRLIPIDERRRDADSASG